MLCENITTQNGHLYFAGCDTVELAKTYGTPLYLMDEDRVRKNCRTYLTAMQEHFSSAMPLFASKALSCTWIYKVVAEEGMGTDVVSLGELFSARKAGFPLEKVFFHGNAKTDSDIATAMDWGVGYFIIDNEDELRMVSQLAGERGITQKALLRLTPGIDPHTFEAVCTGQVDSKFGVPIETGQAMEFVKLALSLPHLEICGYHTHVGSQVFTSEVFYDTADIMLQFVADARDALGYTASMLNLGGGYGVRYVESDPHVDIAAEIGHVARHVKENCKKLNIPEPMILMEPGRSIVADAGMTLYTVQSIKTIPGYRNYVGIDGGMTDNPRYALYGSAYTVEPASRMDDTRDFPCTIGGRCCESGDMIQENVSLPVPRRGDILAVCTTGAYNYSMSSNYNSVRRPAMVALSGEKASLVLRRETFEDLCSRDV